MARISKARQISVKQELVIGFTAIIVLLLFVTGIALYSQQRSVTAVDKLINRDTELAELALKGNNALFRARRYEKDFYLNFHEIGFAESKARYVTLFRIQIAQIKANIREIRSLDTSTTTGASTREIEDILGKYESGFLTAIDLYSNLGHYKTGLEGVFREKIHALETQIQDSKSDRLMVDMLTIRRHEKDFLLRGVQSKTVDVRNAVAALNADLKSAALTDVQRAAFVELADGYLQTFNAFVATSEKINEAKTGYLTAVHTVEPLLENLYLNATQGAENTRAEVYAQATVTSRTVILASIAATLIGLLVAYLVARHVTRSVQASMYFAQQVASGNLESHIAPPNQKEFAALANALNIMANALRTARSIQESKAAELEDRVIERTHELAGTNDLLTAEIETRRHTEVELHQAKEVAEAATRGKSEFLANMSHEIRTPMNGVIGLTTLVLKTPLSGQQREYLHLIQSSADSLLRLLNDILDFSKMEARKLELDVIEFDLRESIGNTLKGFAATANEKSLELTYHVASDIPGTLLGDPGRLTQIIVNLVGNALKFTNRGEVVLRVTQEQSSAGATVLHVSISDTGIGISKEQQQYIFNAFAQADSSTTRQYGGTGLGLAIVSQLVSLMAGRIWVESEPEQGTTFHFTVRLALSEHPSSHAMRNDTALLKNMRMLVVDDNQSNRLILGDILTSWDMRPVLAKNGEEALALLLAAAEEGAPFPMVLIDAQMPQLDGFQLVESIASASTIATTPIMMLSSRDVTQELVRCNALGIDRFLSKPVKPSELFNAIMNANGGAAPEQARGGVEAPALTLPAARSLHVLVAEDHPINQRLVAEILKDRGHTFMIANNGNEALALLDRHAFDVVLMDGQMPEMDGYQATREIRRREQSSGRHLRIIAVTAHAMSEDRDICLAAGMDDYVSKPIDADQLIERLEFGSAQQDTALTTVANNQEDAMPAPAAFDYDSALKRARGKQALLKQLIHAFQQDLPHSLEQIAAAIDAADASALERAAHRLRGAAATISATPLADAAAALEDIGRHNLLAEAPPAEQLLRQRAAELEVALNRLE